MVFISSSTIKISQSNSFKISISNLKSSLIYSGSLLIKTAVFKWDNLVILPILITPHLTQVEIILTQQGELCLIDQCVRWISMSHFPSWKLLLFYSYRLIIGFRVLWLCDFFLPWHTLLGTLSIYIWGQFLKIFFQNPVEKFSAFRMR